MSDHDGVDKVIHCFLNSSSPCHTELMHIIYSNRIPFPHLRCPLQRWSLAGHLPVLRRGPPIGPLFEYLHQRDSVWVSLRVGIDNRKK